MTGPEPKDKRPLIIGLVVLLALACLGFASMALGVASAPEGERADNAGDTATLHA